MIYCGGPIDLAVGDPDQRHRALRVALNDAGNDARIYCPLCDHRAHMAGVELQLARNTLQLEALDHAVFFWDARTQASIGTPIEIYQRAIFGKPSVVVGSLGAGMFQRWLEQRGVTVTQDLAAAVRLVSA